MFSLIRKSNSLVNCRKLFLFNYKLQTNGKHNHFMRNSVKKVITNEENNANPNIKSLLKPFLFTIGFSGTAFAFCEIWNFENTRQQFNNWMKTNNYKNNQKKGHLRNQLNQWWNSRSEGFKLFSAIALVNGIVFIGWKVPRLQNFMLKYFMTQTNTKSLKCWPMLLSTFSHYSPVHLIINMIVIKSFSDIGVHLFGTEQFLALYLSSGVISSFASYFYKVIVVRSGSSLGASGAILGILASCCVARPDLQLMIVFLPFFTISAGMALKGIIMLDTAGLLLKWGFFDHAAHLGGALFGVWYATYGQNIIWDNRKEVIRIWQQIRNLFSK